MLWNEYGTHVMPMTPFMAIGAGIISAVAMFSIVAGSALALPLFYFASLPLYLVGLGIGTKGLIFSLAAAISTAGLMGGMLVALPFALAYGVPVWMTCRLASMNRVDEAGHTHWYPAGSIAGGLTLLAVGLMGMTVFYVGSGGDAGGLQESVAAFLNHALTSMAAQMPDELRADVVQALSPFFPGMVAASWVVMHMVNAIAAQGALNRSGKALRPSPRYTEITLPDWCSWALVAMAAVALVAPADFGYVARNGVILPLVPFFLLGLAVVHTMAQRLSYGTPMLVVFYMMLMVFGWAALAVAGAGVIEQWAGLRKRFASGSDQETD